MKHLTLFDTSIGTANQGDGIIMYFCQLQLKDILRDNYFTYKVPTHLEIGKKTYECNKVSDYSIVCGTNILKTSIITNQGWRLRPWDVFNLRGLCLMGAGWSSYKEFSFVPYTRWAYHHILAKNMLHSVRDSYTERRMRAIGFDNVINTACPTMWRLTPDFCRTIPTRKHRNVITSLTDYEQNPELDKLMLVKLHANYEKVYFWIQQDRDLEYLKSLDVGFPIDVIGSDVKQYCEFLREADDCDYIGSRLHGGICALNYGIRTLVVGVDNRAAEIHKDTKLPFIKREDISMVDNWINSEQCIELELPWENISKWKSQFQDNT